MITELKTENFEEMTKKGCAVVDLYAEWCGPCKMMEPVFEKLSKEFKNINFFRLNVDTNQQIAVVYAVRSIPTTLFLNEGKEVDRIIGFVYEDEFRKRIKQAFK